MEPGLGLVIGAEQIIYSLSFSLCGFSCGEYVTPQLHSYQPFDGTDEVSAAALAYIANLLTLSTTQHSIFGSDLHQETGHWPQPTSRGNAGTLFLHIISRIHGSPYALLGTRSDSACELSHRRITQHPPGISCDLRSSPRCHYVCLRRISSKPYFPETRARITCSTSLPPYQNSFTRPYR